MESLRRILKVLGIILFVVGVLVYLYGLISLHNSGGVAIDYSSIGKLSLVVGFVLMLVSAATRKGEAGQLARTTGVNLLGVLFAFFFLFSAWGLYALGYGLSLYSIVLGIAGLYLLVRVILSFRNKN